MARGSETGSSRRARRVGEAVALPLLGIAVALTTLEVAPRVGVLPGSSFPPTSDVLRALAAMLPTAELWTTIGHTLSAWARAMAIAAVLAIPLGLAIGASRTGALLSRLTVEFLRPIPSVSLIPVLVLVYGTRSSLTVALGAFAAALPLLFQAMYAIADVDAMALDTGRVFRLGRVDRVRWIVLPSCAPYLATGLRISASVALILVVTGEYMAGVEGLGQKVLVTQSGAAYDRMYAWIAVTGMVGLLLNLAFHALERHYLSWHPGQPGRREEGRL
jgi:ABC-type nitrate/sulfonate/bicarbonate transport system permease component